MSVATVQFAEMVRQAHADLLSRLALRWCLVCESKTDQEEKGQAFRCLACGFVEAVQ